MTREAGLVKKPDEISGEDRRRKAILDAAAQLIAERGYAAVRIADIAEVVQVSTGAVHYYFPGKSDVLTAALQHAIENAFERQSAELRTVDNAHHRLLKLIDMQLPRAGAVRDEWCIWLQFWNEAALRPELRPVHTAYYARWREAVTKIILRGQRQGVFRQTADAETVAHRLTAMTDGLAIQILTGSPVVTLSAMKELLVRLVQDELGTTS